jgi:hypothetical protein
LPYRQNSRGSSSHTPSQVASQAADPTNLYGSKQASPSKPSPAQSSECQGFPSHLISYNPYPYPSVRLGSIPTTFIFSITLPCNIPSHLNFTSNISSTLFNNPSVKQKPELVSLWLSVKVQVKNIKQGSDVFVHKPACACINISYNSNNLTRILSCLLPQPTIDHSCS